MLEDKAQVSSADVPPYEPPFKGVARALPSPTVTLLATDRYWVKTGIVFLLITSAGPWLLARCIENPGSPFERGAAISVSVANTPVSLPVIWLAVLARHHRNPANICGRVSATNSVSRRSWDMA